MQDRFMKQVFKGKPWLRTEIAKALHDGTFTSLVESIRNSGCQKGKNPETQQVRGRVQPGGESCLGLRSGGSSRCHPKDLLNSDFTGKDLLNIEKSSVSPFCTRAKT